MGAGFIRVTDRFSVAGQLTPEAVASAARSGFAHLVNNRPDNETVDQPKGSDIAAAAAANGIGYSAIPVDHGGFTMEMVQGMADALERAGGPVLAFCRSGTRSTNLWALAEASRGGEPDAIVGAAAAAGYDVSGLLPALRQLAARAR